MKPPFVQLFLFLFVATAASSSTSPPNLDSLENLVRAYELTTHPDMTSPYQLELTGYDIPWLWDSLQIDIFYAGYRSEDGTFFRNEVFLYRNGAVRYSVATFGGSGLTSGVMLNNPSGRVFM